MKKTVFFENIETSETNKNVVENQLKDLMDKPTINTLTGANSEETVTSIHKDYIETRSLSNFFT